MQANPYEVPTKNPYEDHNNNQFNANNSPGPAAWNTVPAGYSDSGPMPVAAEGVVPSSHGGVSPARDQPVTGIPLYGDDVNNPELRSRFVVDGYKDMWASILFGINVFINIVVGIANFAKGLPSVANADPAAANFTSADEGVSTLARGTATSLAFIIPLLLLMLFLIRKFPEKFIIWCNIAIIVFLFISSIGLMAAGNIGVGVMNLIFVCIYMLWLWCVRYRIPLAAVMLETSSKLNMNHWGCIVTSFGAVAVTFIYAIFWAGMAFPTMHDLMVSDQASGAQTAYFLYQLLMFYWVSQVATNVVHVTVAGVVATWYFVGSEDLMPQNPTPPSLKRAMTTSFGSICFGSLIVAILQLIRFLARQMYEHNKNSAVACIALCVINCIERLVEYFNLYAFTHVAIYGSSYIEAAKQTWEFIKSCVWSAVINDNLVGAVFTMLTLFDSLFIATACGALFDGSGAVWFGAFMLSLLFHSVVFRTIESGVVTFFVCAAEAPDVLDKHHPALKARVNDAIAEANRAACSCGDDNEQQSQNAGNNNAPPSNMPAQAGDV